MLNTRAGFASGNEAKEVLPELHKLKRDVGLYNDLA